MSPETHDHDLPADLIELGEQLTREASMLSERYPPKAPDAEPARVAVTSRGVDIPALPLISAGIALGVLCAVSLIGFDSFSAVMDQPLAGPAAQATADGPTARVADLSPSPSRDERTAREIPVGIGLPIDQPPPLSPPEWEAVLDLTPAEDWEGIELSL